LYGLEEGAGVTWLQAGWRWAVTITCNAEVLPRSLPNPGCLLSSGWKESWLQAVSLLPFLVRGRKPEWPGQKQKEIDRCFTCFCGLNSLCLDCKFSCRPYLPP